MATQLLIDDVLLEEARRLGQHQSSSEVVAAALEEYIIYRKQRQIVESFGQIDYDSPEAKPSG